MSWFPKLAKLNTRARLYAAVDVGHTSVKGAWVEVTREWGGGEWARARVREPLPQLWTWPDETAFVPEEEGAAGGPDDPIEQLLEASPIEDQLTGQEVSVVFSLPAGMRQELLHKLGRKDVHHRSVIVAEPDQWWPFSINYGTPQTVGTDRLAACLAAWARNPGTSRIWVITAGTAITVNGMIDGGGKPEFQGGAILAGYRSTLRGLAQGAPTLAAPVHPILQDLEAGHPLVAPKTRAKTNPNTTLTNLQIGVHAGVPGAVYGCLLYLGMEPGESIWITGGDGERLRDGLRPLLDPASKQRMTASPHLVLEGLALYADQLPL